MARHKGALIPARTMPGGAAADAINRSIIALARLNYALAGEEEEEEEQQHQLEEEACKFFVVAKTISILYGLDHIISIMPARSIWSERQANNPCPFRARTGRRSLLCVCVCVCRRIMSMHQR